jgi:hypothetical protein
MIKSLKKLSVKTVIISASAQKKNTKRIIENKNIKAENKHAGKTE